MKSIKKILVPFIVLFSMGLSAQNTIVNHEVGVFLGPAFMQTDYGEDQNFTSSTSNVGMDFGIAWIADLSDSRYDSKTFAWLADHMKMRVELSFSKVSLEHDEARITEGSQTTTDRFKGVSGEVKLTNLGFLQEWNFKSIARNASKFSPYFLSGISYSSARSTLSFDQNVGLPNAYLPTSDNLFLGTNDVFSYTGGLGARYKLKDVDLVAEGRFQGFFSDRVEGIDTDRSGDDHNDTQVIFKIGAIFHLD